MINMAVNMAEMLDHIAPFFALCSQGSASPQPGGSTTPTDALMGGHMVDTVDMAWKCQGSNTSSGHALGAG